MGSFIKFLQCTIAVACLWFHYNTMELEFDIKMNILLTGTFFGYTIICGVLMIGELFQKPSEKFVDAVFCVVGSVLFVLCGFYILRDWSGGFNEQFQTKTYKQASVKGSLAIANAILLMLNVWC